MSNTQQKFIERSNHIHGNKFDYSLVQYSKVHDTVAIICPTHGIFHQKAYSHLRGIGCKLCGKASRLLKTQIEFESVFAQRANEIHNNLYNYSKSTYINTHSKIEILCSKHGSFFMTPQHHLQGQGCRKCANIEASISRTKTAEDFIKSARSMHGPKYSYELVEYQKSWTLIKIVCATHGIFEQTPNTHLSGSGCPTCKSSKGESKIRNFLIQHNIAFEEQKKFDECINPKTGRKLVYDFYLPDRNLLIEYDGIQHFRPSFGRDKVKSHEAVKYCQYKDSIKTDYASSVGVTLLRIPYTCIDVEFLLSQHLCS